MLDSKRMKAFSLAVGKSDHAMDQKRYLMELQTHLLITMSLTEFTSIHVALVQCHTHYDA